MLKIDESSLMKIVTLPLFIRAVLYYPKIVRFPCLCYWNFLGEKLQIFGIISPDCAECREECFWCTCYIIEKHV